MHSGTEIHLVAPKLFLSRSIIVISAHYCCVFVFQLFLYNYIGQKSFGITVGKNYWPYFSAFAYSSCEVLGRGNISWLLLNKKKLEGTESGSQNYDIYIKKSSLVLIYNVSPPMCISSRTRGCFFFVCFFTQWDLNIKNVSPIQACCLFRLLM